MWSEVEQPRLQNQPDFSLNHFPTVWCSASCLTLLSLFPQMYNGNKYTFYFILIFLLCWVSLTCAFLLSVKNKEREWNWSRGHSRSFSSSGTQWPQTWSLALIPQRVLELSFFSGKDLNAGVCKVCSMDHWQVTLVLQMLWSSGWKSAQVSLLGGNREAPWLWVRLLVVLSERWEDRSLLLVAF